MATTLRDFLEIPYDKLEEMNLATKEARAQPHAGAQDPREAREDALTDEKRIKAVTVCFTDLEGRLHMLDYDKKFLAQVGRQPDLRRVVDPRLLAAGRIGSAARHRLAGLVLAAVGRVRSGQGAGVRRRARKGRLALRGRHARASSRRSPRSSSPRTAPSSTPPTRSRASCSRAATPSGTTTRPAGSSSSARAATTTRCPATAADVHRHRGRSAARARASPTRRIIRKWRRRSSR